jgi:DNA-binding GntR family transcriptional regulator
MAPPRLMRVPVYQQLAELLRELLRGKSLAPGQQFLTEREVAERYEVSRATANKAISTLVTEGLLEFRKGAGTFLRGHRIDTDLRELVSFTAAASSAGSSPTTKVLSFRIHSASGAPKDVDSTLGLGRMDMVTAMERLRLADGQPLILERRWLPSLLVPKLTEEDVAGSIYSALTQRHGLTVGGCVQQLSAVNLGREEARHLAAKPGSAALQVASTAFLADGRPLWHERTLYRSDGYTFVNRLGNAPGKHAPGLRALLTNE